MKRHLCHYKIDGRPCGNVRECHPCYKFATDQRYHDLWGGKGQVEPSPELAAHWATRLGKPVQALAPKATPRGPCRHLGSETGERRECASGCKGRVQVKLLACAIHGSCTQAKPVGVACCATCPDHSSA